MTNWLATIVSNNTMSTVTKSKRIMQIMNSARGNKGYMSEYSEWLDAGNLEIDAWVEEGGDYLEHKNDDLPSAKGLAELWARQYVIDSEKLFIRNWISWKRTCWNDQRIRRDVHLCLSVARKRSFSSSITFDQNTLNQCTFHGPGRFR